LEWHQGVAGGNRHSALRTFRRWQITGSSQKAVGSVCRSERIAKYNRLLELDAAGIGLERGSWR
jgi:hypothetical protein